MMSLVHPVPLGMENNLTIKRKSTESGPLVYVLWRHIKSQIAAHILSGKNKESQGCIILFGIWTMKATFVFW